MSTDHRDMILSTALTSRHPALTYANWGYWVRVRVSRLQTADQLSDLVTFYVIIDTEIGHDFRHVTADQVEH